MKVKEEKKDKNNGTAQSQMYTHSTSTATTEIGTHIDTNCETNHETNQSEPAIRTHGTITSDSSFSSTNTAKTTANKPNKSIMQNQQHHQQQRRPTPIVSKPTIQSLTFNQDKNCIAIATSTGYRICSLSLSILLDQHPQQTHTTTNNNTNNRNTSMNTRHVKLHQVTYPPIALSNLQ